MSHTFGSNSHLVLSVVLQETLDTAAGELVKKVSFLSMANLGDKVAALGVCNYKQQGAVKREFRTRRKPADLTLSLSQCCRVRVIFLRRLYFEMDSLASQPLRCATSVTLSRSPSRQ